jgi:hypothetical protein
MKHQKKPAPTTGAATCSKSLVAMAVAAALMGAAAPSLAATPVIIKGVVSGTLFTPPVISDNPSAAAAPTTVASTYAGATVCVDLNANGQCDQGEPSTISKSDGTFQLGIPGADTGNNLVAMIPTTATNNGAPVTQRMVFRVNAGQIAAATVSPLAPVSIAVTPLSTEITRMVENDGMSYTSAASALALRLGVSSPTEFNQSLGSISIPADQAAIEAESVVLSNRWGLAASLFDHGNLASMGAAQQGAMNLESIPRYDHIFIIMLENKSSSSVNGNTLTPNIDALLANNNQFTNYFATGNPSEPNYTALGGADDFGLTDDDPWNCNATGANAPQDLPLPVGGSSSFQATCTDSSNLDHNIVGHPNLFNALVSAGMTWRTYNESTNPGQDFRADGVADPKITALDHIYPAGTVQIGASTNTSQIGTTGLVIPMPSQLYRTKHHPGMAYQNVRSEYDFVSSNRTLGGGQWINSSNFSTTSLYPVPANYDPDQFSTDLASGNVGQLNFVIPDQCDDMHSITVQGTVPPATTKITASDCFGVSNGVNGGNDPVPNVQTDMIMKRGDTYVQYLVNKIEASALWQNPYQRNAIVIMFDEGGATFNSTSDPFDSCCGYNPNNSSVAVPVIANSAGVVTGFDTTGLTSTLYFNGNRGHGNSIFGVIQNHPAATGVQDSDAYSHFSFVRTLQDMFGLANPTQPGSYMNRSKYTQAFIAANSAFLTEYASSADPYFDAVRPMNGQYMVPDGFTLPGGYLEKVSSDTTVSGMPLTGAAAPATPKVNVWALPSALK